MYKIVIVLLLVMVTLSGCATDASVVSENISLEADQFRVNRRIAFINGITDEYLLSIEGLCSLSDDGRQLEVTCKVGADSYKKHFLGLSDNVTYVAEHLDASNVSKYHYKVVFKPQSLVPAIEVSTSLTD